jgi:ribosomal protein L7Ae-like RNA K-turn-binding protein
MNELDEQQRIKIAGYLGIAQKAGRIAAGDNNVREALKKKKVELLVLAQDVSAQIKEEITLIANEQGIGIIYWPNKLDLGLVVGKSKRGAVGVLDPGFAKAIIKVTKI